MPAFAGGRTGALAPGRAPACREGGYVSTCLNDLRALSGGRGRERRREQVECSNGHRWGDSPAWVDCWQNVSSETVYDEELKIPYRT